MAQKYYVITRLCKEDILNSFEGYSDDAVVAKVKARLKTMTKNEMEYLASKMADDYCNQLYWDSARTIFTDRFLRR